MVDDFKARIRASKIIKTLGITHPAEIAIEDIAWVRGALVQEGGLRGAEARLVHTPGISPAIIRIKSGIRPEARKRFTIAHELGHLELDHDPAVVTECTEDHFRQWYQAQNNQEAEASAFAAHLLMPESLFAPKLEKTVPSMELIDRLATEFKTTLTATAIRYAQLCGEQCAVVCSKGGKVAWVARSPDFRWWIPVNERLNSNTFAADYFQGKPIPPGMQDIRLDSWVENVSRQGDPWQCREDSLALTSYDSVLTLLWVP